MMPQLGIRWTIGDVNPAGFDALRLSIHGAMRLFGSEAAYRIYVNTIPADEARRRVGAIADAVQWLPVDGDIPPLLRSYLGDGMAEGVAWKLLPLRRSPTAFDSGPFLAMGLQCDRNDDSRRIGTSVPMRHLQVGLC